MNFTGYYPGRASTAQAKQYLAERDAEARASGQVFDRRMQQSRAWLAAWHDQQRLKNSLANVRQRNAESEHGISEEVQGGEDRGQAARPEAAVGGTGEGMGDAPGQQAEALRAEGDGVDSAGAGGQSRWTAADDTPF